MATLMRLDRFLVSTGEVSRREAKRLLKHAIVTINGKEVTDPSTKVNPSSDSIMVDGKAITQESHVYFALNKPKEIISTTWDELGRANVVDLIDTTRTIYPIGRLDKDTHGLILLTDDGELTHKLIHPKYHVDKVYEVTAQGKVHPHALKELAAGIELSGEKTLPAKVALISTSDTQTIFHIAIHEGRFQQVRRMCKKTGITLVDLKRIQFGPIMLGDLEEGKSRELTKEEIQQLQEATNQ